MNYNSNFSYFSDNMFGQFRTTQIGSVDLLFRDSFNPFVSVQISKKLSSDSLSSANDSFALSSPTNSTNSLYSTNSEKSLTSPTLNENSLSSQYYQIVLITKNENEKYKDIFHTSEIACLWKLEINIFNKKYRFFPMLLYKEYYQNKINYYNQYYGKKLCKCKDNFCKKTHNLNEISGIIKHITYKTTKCPSFHSLGYCENTNCHFIHNISSAFCLNKEFTDEEMTDLLVEIS